MVGIYQNTWRLTLLNDTRAKEEISREVLTYFGTSLVAPVVKNPPANAGDTGSSPGPGRSHMPWSN